MDAFHVVVGLWFLVFVGWVFLILLEGSLLFLKLVEVVPFTISPIFRN